MLTLPMLSPNQVRRRYYGVILLSVALGLLFWGTLVFQPVLTGWRQTAYGILCTFVASGACGLALWELTASLFSMRRSLAALRRRSNV